MQNGTDAPAVAEIPENRRLLERIYDAGGLLSLDAPDDDAAYPAYHEMVETLLTITRTGSIRCEAAPDRRRPGRTYLSVVVTITVARSRKPPS